MSTLATPLSIPTTWKGQPHPRRIPGAIPELRYLPPQRSARKDFGLTWNAALETGSILVGDEVSVTLDVQFVKP